MKPTDWFPLLGELADRADALALRYFRAGDLHVDQKVDRSLVTQADLEIEEMVRAVVAARHPDVGVFGEEQGEGTASPRRLIVDPIDATANFARGIPIFATLLAVEVDREIVAGMVSAAALGQRWHAARGAGAYSGERKLRVSGVEEMAAAQIFHGSLHGAEAVPQSKHLPGLLAKSWRQRGFGDFYQHMLVAEGAGEIACDPVVNPWDIAALQVIVEEAGGQATTLAGVRDIYGKSLISSNGRLHAEALRAFSDSPA
jgi:histidinol-phosphatase